MSILQRIVEVKREEVSFRRKNLGERVQPSPHPQAFLRAIQSASSKPALIAEVKRASPSEGVIRDPFNGVEIAKAYESAGAHCLSVLTDEQFFQGSNDVLRQVRAAVSLPILRKDFVIDKWQVDEARALGADAILLIAAILDRVQIQDFANRAWELGMDALVEVHDERELEKALEASADLIGVNNRDLNSFKTDLATTERLFELLPEGITKVSESGLNFVEEVTRVRQAGAHAVLIGTAFCREPNIEAAVRRVMGR